MLGGAGQCRPALGAGEASTMAGWQLERALAGGLGPALADVGALERGC